MKVIAQFTRTSKIQLEKFSQESLHLKAPTKNSEIVQNKSNHTFIQTNRSNYKSRDENRCYKCQ